MLEINPVDVINAENIVLGNGFMEVSLPLPKNPFDKVGHYLFAENEDLMTMLIETTIAIEKKYDGAKSLDREKIIQVIGFTFYRQFV